MLRSPRDSLAPEPETGAGLLDRLQRGRLKEEKAGLVLGEEDGAYVLDGSPAPRQLLGYPAGSGGQVVELGGAPRGDVDLDDVAGHHGAEAGGGSARKDAPSLLSASLARPSFRPRWPSPC